MAYPPSPPRLIAAAQEGFSRANPVMRAGGFIVLMIGATASAGWFRTPGGVSLWFPPAALALALLVFGGWRWIWLVMTARILAVLLLGWPVADLIAVLGSALVVSATYAGGAEVLRRQMSAARSHVVATAHFVLLGVMATPFVAAVLTRVVVEARGVATNGFLTTAVDFWVGDAVAIATLCPILLILTSRDEWPPLTKDALSGLAIGASCMAATLLALSWSVGNDQRVLYICFFPAAWAALRFGLPGAGVAIAAVGLTVAGGWRLGFLGDGDLTEIHLFVVALTLFTLATGAISFDRLAAFRDLERTEAKLRAATIRLEEASKLKDQFLDVASHELRNPLTSILGFADLLSSDGDRLASTTRQEISGRIAGAAANLSQMVQRLLDYSRIQNGRILVSPRYLVVHEHLRQHLAAPDGRYSQHRIEVDSPPGLLAFVDPEALGHIVDNLLGNAIKYSPPGSLVTIKADHDGADTRISIADEGPGISPEDRERVFQHHFRLDRDAGRSGFGIGLSIVSRYVEAHGGHVELESELGQGATFTVCLPTHLGYAGTEEPVRKIVTSREKT